MQNNHRNLGQNSLVSPIEAGKSFRKPRSKVTIAIGLICENPDLKETTSAPHIILASDSQTTYPGATKSLNAKKIEVITFEDAEVLVAQSGPSDLGNKVIEIMQRKAVGVAVDDSETIIKIVQESMKEVRFALTELNKGCNFSYSDWKRFFWEDNDLNLLVAFYFKQKPYLYTIDLDKCMMILVREKYKAIGRGEYFARFLLGEYQQIDPHFQFSIPIALSIIEKTVDNIEGCGRPSWAGLVYPMNEFVAKISRNTGAKVYHSLTSKVDTNLINLMIEELKSAEQDSVPIRKKELLKTFRKTVTKYHALIIKMSAVAARNKSNPIPEDSSPTS